MNASSNKHEQAIVLELVSGGVANAIASMILNPFDVVKVRLQTQGQGFRPVLYTSTYDAAKQIVKTEGIVTLNGGGLWMPGLFPSILRELSYSSFRFGLYSPIKSLFNAESKSGDVGLPAKIVSGATSGAVGSGLATPTDLVKIQFQAQAGRVHPSSGKYVTGLHKGREPCFASTLDAFRKIYIAQGVSGMWTGWQPTMARAACLAAAQLATYDHTKYFFRENGWMEDGVRLHVTGSLTAAVAALVVTQPFDTVKSRVMADRNGKLYTGPFDCAAKTVRSEGPLAFYRGSLASYLRYGPHFIIALALWEQVRYALGLGYLK